MEEQVSLLLEPIVREVDVALLAVKVSGGRGRKQVCVTVDRKGGVSCELLARVNRALALQLDAADLFAAPYQLEVGSPGLDWPLTSQEDLQRHQDEWLEVTDHHGMVVEGRNLDADVDGFSIMDRKKNVKRFEFVDVAKVVRAINWKEVSNR